MSEPEIHAVIRHGPDETYLDFGGWEDLSEMGLRVRYRDGSENAFLGVLRYPGEWTHDAVGRFCREALATIYVPVEGPPLWSSVALVERIKKQE